MKTVFQVVLALVALFSGGCSLFFLIAFLSDFGGFDSLMLIPLAGLGLAALCFWGLRALSRKP